MPHHDTIFLLIQIQNFGIIDSCSMLPAMLFVLKIIKFRIHLTQDQDMKILAQGLNDNKMFIVRQLDFIQNEL